MMHHEANAALQNGSIRKSAVAGLALSLLISGTALPSAAQDAIDPSQPAAETGETKEAQKSTFGSADVEGDVAASMSKGAPRAQRRGLDEIIVTAQKTEQDIREVPISVSAISGESLKDQNIQDFTELSKYTPNLSVNASGVFNGVSIRGLGSGQMEGFEQAVGLIIDDVYAGRVHYLTQAFLDVKQVEILRGPQGTLFGKNTIAGALIINTTNPSYEWEVDVTGEIGDFERRSVNAAINVPIIDDRLALRVSGRWAERGGFATNTFFDAEDGANEQKLIRAKLKFDITDTADVILTVVHNQYDVPNGVGVELSRADGGMQVAAPLYDDEFEADINRQGSMNEMAMTDLTTTDFSGRANFELFNQTFAVIAAHSIYDRDNRIDADFSPLPLVQLDQLDEYEQTTLEIRVNGDAFLGDWGEIEYVGGAYLFRSELDAFQNIQIFQVDNLGRLIGTPLDNITGQNPLLGLIFNTLLNTPNAGFVFETRETSLLQETKSVAAFGQVTWHIKPWISLLVGMRYAVETKTGDLFAQNYEFGAVPSPGLILAPVLNADNFDYTGDNQLFRRESDFSPKFSVIWRATDEINVYATYAIGFKGGGYNTQSTSAALTDIAFEPEESKTIELGLKAEFLDGVGRVNFGLFRTKFKNLQTFVFNGLAPIVRNAAESVSQGLEIEGGAVLPWGFFIGGNYSFLDAFYTSYENGPCIAGQDGFCDLTGKKRGNPRNQFTFITDYTTGLFNWPIEMVIGGDLYFQTRQIFESDRDPFDAQDAYYLVNLRASLRSIDGWWNVSLFVRNVMDRTIKTRSSDVAFFTGSHWVTTNDPRTFAVQLRATF